VSDNPFHNRAAEWELYSPLVGRTMLELGDKRNGNATYKAFFTARGYRHVSVDWNAKNGALPLDLRVPLKLGTFDMVTNIGTTEHVDEQVGVWRNLLEAMHAGSVLVSTTPLPGDWWWHGYWHPDETFFEELAPHNGLQIERLYVAGEEPRRMVMARLVRVGEVRFTMPERALIRRNDPTIRPRPR